MKSNFTSKHLKLMALGALILPLLSNSSKLLRPTQAPIGYSGADGIFCTDCHSTYALNTSGGSVSASLPTAINANQTYNFNVVINATEGRRRFGFSVKAVDANGNAVGTFSTTNANTIVSSGELGHRNAILGTADVTSYTYSNLSWQAPASIPTGGVKFYAVGLAGNGVSGTSNDYVYSQLVNATEATALSVNVLSFTAKNTSNGTILSWKTTDEIDNNGFELEKSTNGTEFLIMTYLKAKSAKNNEYSFTELNNNTKTTYYRLKHIDTNGKIGYSKIVSVEPAEKTILASPNPSTGLFTLKDFPSNTKVEVISALGKTFSGTVNELHQVNISHLPAGIYYVKGFGTKTVKLLKK
jgi:hypothetical protein